MNDSKLIESLADSSRNASCGLDSTDDENGEELCGGVEASVDERARWLSEDSTWNKKVAV